MRAHFTLGSVLVLLAASGPARAGATISLGAPVVAVAASSSRLLAATSREVLLLDSQGTILRRLSIDQGTPTTIRPLTAPDPFAASAGVVSDSDFDDPHDADSEVEDAENLTVTWQKASRRAEVPASASSRSVVAVDEQFAWWGRADGLWRMALNGDGLIQVLRGTAQGVQALATSPDGKYVAAQSDGVVLRSNDGGATFARLFPVAGATALSLSPTGTLLVLDSSGLLRTSPEATTPVPVGLSQADAIATCGSTTLALVAGRLLVLDPTGARPVLVASDTPPADSRGLTCSPEGGLWAAIGARLWTSTDQGQSGLVRDDLPPVAVTAIAATNNGVWLAGPLGLWFEPAQPASRTKRMQPPRDLRTLSSIEARIRAAPWWLLALPRVEVGFASARSASRHDVRAFVLLTFTFQRNTERGLERQRLLASLARRQRIPLALPSPGEAEASVDSDVLRREETEALSHIEETSP